MIARRNPSLSPSDGDASAGSLARDLLIDRQGRVVVVGEYGAAGGGREFAVLRLDADGNFDPDFGATGSGMIHVPVAGTDSTANAVALAPDQDGTGDDLVVVGRAMVSSNNQFAVVRLNDDGGLDPLFGGVTGKVTTRIGNSN